MVADVGLVGPFAAVGIVVGIVPGAGAGKVEAGDEVGAAESVENVGIEVEDVGPGAAIGEASVEIVVGVKGAAGEVGFDEGLAAEAVPVNNARRFLYPLAVTIILISDGGLAGLRGGEQVVFGVEGEGVDAIGDDVAGSVGGVTHAAEAIAGLDDTGEV